MLNCKIRFTKSWPSMGVHAGDTATFADGLLHYPNGYVGTTAYFETYDFKALNPVAEFEVIEWEGKPVKIEDHPAFKNDAQKLPRICYILGGEKTPLKIREIFEFESTLYTIAAADDSLYMPAMCTPSGELVSFVGATVFARMVQNPDQIIRRPQFSDDEKALMRMYVGIGLKWFARDQTNEIVTYPRQPHRGDDAFEPEGNDTYLIIPEKFLSQITWENSPFDAVAYLESEESK